MTKYPWPCRGCGGPIELRPDGRTAYACSGQCRSAAWRDEQAGRSDAELAERRAARRAARAREPARLTPGEQATIRHAWLAAVVACYASRAAEQPTSLVPFADDEGFYNPRKWGQGKIRQPDDVEKWLKTVLYNAVRNAIRDQRLHREILAEVVLEPNHWTHVENHGESAEATFMRRESEREILGRIKGLPRHLGQVAYLRYWGFPNGEIAWLLNIHINTVKQRLRTIRSPKIRRALGLSS